MSLTFTTSPEVILATNKFINTPIILQFDDTPIIEMKKSENSQFGLNIPIYHNDGTKLATVKGSRLFLTEGGKKADLVLSHPQNMEICKLDGKVLFELKREGAAAVTATAELFAPGGYFIKSRQDHLYSHVFQGESELKLGSVSVKNCIFDGMRIGIHLLSNGDVGIGCR